MAGIEGATIRPGHRGDLPDLVGIYNHFVLETAVTFDVDPHTVESRSAWFDAFSLTGRYRLFVIDVAGAPVGYCHSQALRPKQAYETSVETTVYLKPGFEGRGLGQALYERLLSALRAEDVHRAYGVVAQPNNASNALHRKLGFHEVAFLGQVGRKFGRYHDVMWFELAFPSQSGETDRPWDT